MAAASSALQSLVTLGCIVLVTSQSYTSLKSILLNHGHGSTRVLPEKCLPKCEDSDGNPLSSTHVRDPSSCRQYWVCLQNGTLYEQPHVCQDDEIVNIETLLCEPEVVGSDQCDIPDPDCDESIPKVCYTKDTCPPPEDGIFAYADEDDCGKYHVCNFGDQDILCGEAAPYFNGQECVDDPSQCCHCHATCKTTWTTIPDPKDDTCQNYYLCQGLDSALSGCKDTMECTAIGFFPRCTNVCDPGFFMCTGRSVKEKETVTPEFCMNGQVFDPNATPNCVSPDYCSIVGYIASDEEKFTCLGEEKFDASSGECSAEITECSPTCASSSTPDSTTESTTPSDF